MSDAKSAKEVLLDQRRRTNLARVGQKRHSRYLVDELDDGTLIWTPAVVISEQELATLDNPAAMAAIEEGKNLPRSAYKPRSATKQSRVTA